MTAKEAREYKTLCRRWACQKATAKQITRCMELTRKAVYEAKCNLLESV